MGNAHLTHGRTSEEGGSWAELLNGIHSQWNTLVRGQDPSENVSENRPREHHISGNQTDRIKRNRFSRLTFRQSPLEFAAESLDPAQITRPLGQALSPNFGNSVDTDASADDSTDNRRVRIGVAAATDDRLNRGCVVDREAQPSVQDDWDAVHHVPADAASVAHFNREFFGWAIDGICRVLNQVR